MPFRPDPFSRLSDAETELLRKPEVPLEQWRKGEPLFASKLKWPKEANNPATKGVKVQKANLRKLIANDAGLVKDFEFFTKKLRWEPEALLQDIYWDCNMMQATLQQILSKEKKRLWPIEKETLGEILGNIVSLARQTRALNRTNFSPARTGILRDASGEPIPLVDERFLLTVFRHLPKILCVYGRELRRKIREWDRHWTTVQSRWASIREGVRQHSLYERIRAEAGKYHAVRLHRLVNAARQVQNLPPVDWLAFRKWLSELKQSREKSKIMNASKTENVHPPVSAS